ncbi:MAG: hypothetical protein EP298_01075 [Gammaproteobacteria bacterium]|nr:MAG: hypothetical protein EP298_01075 [Gammaproteobacteria bacterium]UTW41944.1 hypothetical protein KFE69_10585 [bacterium SCSIO 12844]
MICSILSLSNASIYSSNVTISKHGKAPVFIVLPRTSFLAQIIAGVVGIFIIKQINYRNIKTILKPFRYYTLFHLLNIIVIVSLLIVIYMMVTKLQMQYPQLK